MKLCKQQVIILKQIKFSESDLIMRAITERGALISFIAKGALKSKKRFTGGVLEPGHFIGVEYRISRSSSLHYLQQAWFLKRFKGMRDDYDRLKLALYFLSVIDKVCQEGMDSPELFHLLGNSLEVVGRSQNLFILQFIFEFRLLYCQGVLPKEFHNEKEILGTVIAKHERLTERKTDLEKISKQVHQAIEHYAHLTPA